MMSAKNPSILVVDDESDVLNICEKVLVKAGYTVFTALDAARARRLFDDEKFDLVILDIHMPDEDGISLLKHVHKLDPTLPAILITGYAAVSSVVDAIRLNVREYLCKPFTMKKFLAAVESSLQGSENA
jgi:DNA-binding NtrC family response regulator